MKKLFENWKKYLNEISSEYADEALEWDDLPFDNLFPNDAKRIVIPFSEDSNMGKVASLVQLAKQKLGYELDLRERNVKVKYKELGTQQTKEREEKRYDINLTKFKEVEIPTGEKAGTKTIQKVTKSIMKVLYELYKKKIVDDSQYEELKQLLSDKLESFTKDPHDLFRVLDYSVIVSRAPIDILRMSDHSGMSSCHKEGHDMFYCARAEAQGAGLIAYLVNTSDLDKINLDDDEIFKDSNRRIQGIEPLQRIRLRRVFAGTQDPKYHNNETVGSEIAIPEQRTYGRDKLGLKEIIFNWATETQADIIKNLPLYDQFFQLHLYGGHYQDNDINDTFASMVEHIGSRTRSFSYVYIGNDEELNQENQFQQEVEEAEDEARELQRRAQRNLENCFFSIEVDVEDNFISVSFYGTARFIWSDGLKISLPDDNLQQVFNNHVVEKKLLSALIEKYDFNFEELEIRQEGTALVIVVGVSTEDYDNTIEGTEEYLNKIITLDNQHSDIREYIEEFLIEDDLDIKELQEKLPNHKISNITDKDLFQIGTDLMAYKNFFEIELTPNPLRLRTLNGEPEILDDFIANFYSNYFANNRVKSIQNLSSEATNLLKHYMNLEENNDQLFCLVDIDVSKDKNHHYYSHNDERIPEFSLNMKALYSIVVHKEAEIDDDDLVKVILAEDFENELIELIRIQMNDIVDAYRKEPLNRYYIRENKSNVRR